MGKSGAITDQEVELMQMLRDVQGMSIQEIADTVKRSYNTVKNHIGPDKPKDQTEVMNILGRIMNRLDHITNLLETTDQDGFRITQSFEGEGFTDKNGTFFGKGIRVNMNNRKIFYHYVPNGEKDFKAVTIDPITIECIWTEMVKRGWNYFK